MSNTYICFNDESGSWEDKHCKFYIRASLVVNCEHLKKLESKIINIKNNLQLSKLNEEIKWQDLWLLRRHFKNNTNLKDKRLRAIYDYLRKINKDYHLLIDYCDKVLALLNDANFDIRIILTFTDKDTYPNHKKEDIVKFHNQNHLQRLQMQFQSNNSLVIIIYDSMNEQNKQLFKRIHKNVITTGDFINKYTVVFDSLLFDDSYDNKFLQMADFIAGSFASTLTGIKKNQHTNYKYANKFFEDYIYPRLCKTNKNEVWGAGLIETPSDKHIRKHYKDEIHILMDSMNRNIGRKNPCRQKACFATLSNQSQSRYKRVGKGD